MSAPRNSAPSCRQSHLMKNLQNEHDEPIVVQNDEIISLFFDARAVQSSMYRHDPYGLALGYTRTMMGFLLFQPEPRRISMIGLGGGSLAKYCYRYLPGATIAVVEINPQVIALRDHFHVPRDDERFKVICANGAHYVAEPPEHRPDVILVDAHTTQGIPAELTSRKFYIACHRRLSNEGMLVINLITDEPDFHSYLRTLRTVFGRALTLAPSEDSISNVTVFAWKGSDEILSLPAMSDRASTLQSSQSVNLHAAVQRIEYGKKFDWRRYD